MLRPNAIPGSVPDVVAICPTCGKEDTVDQSECSSCGATIRAGEPYRWSRQTFHLVGTVGWIPASLDLRFRGWSDINGILTIDGQRKPIAVSGKLRGPDDSTLWLLIHGDDHPLRASTLAGQFDGVSFVGNVMNESEGNIAQFKFVASQVGLKRQEWRREEETERRNELFGQILRTRKFFSRSRTHRDGKAVRADYYRVGVVAVETMWALAIADFAELFGSPVGWRVLRLLVMQALGFAWLFHEAHTRFEASLRVEEDKAQ